MSHKIILTVMRRVRNKLLSEISEEQFGFKDCGTRNVVFILGIIGERLTDMQKDVHLAFLDYKKAFNRAKHYILMEDLKSLGTDGKDLPLLSNLYKEQIAATLIDGNLRLLKEGFGKLELEGKIEGRRQRGRQTLKYMNGLAWALGCSVVEVLQCAGDLIGFRNMVANRNF